MKIILIDGPDGVGKTTIAKTIVSRFNENNINAEYVHFPNYDYDTGNYIKKLLYGELGDFTELNPYAAHIAYSLDRFAWFKLNKDKYKDHYIIMDRYKFSSLVYQSSLFVYQKYKTLLSNTEDDSITKVLDVLLTSNVKFVEYCNYIVDLEGNKLGLPDPDVFIWVTADEDTLELRKNNADRPAKDNYEDNRLFNRIVHYIGNMHAKRNPKCTIVYNDSDIDYTVDHVITTIKLSMPDIVL